MINNQTNMNRINPYEILQQQRKRYRNYDRINNSNNNNINNINIIKNYNNKTQNISKNSNIYYINQRNYPNQVNSSQNITAQKYFKSKQSNQIYLEGDLNNFISNQNNIYSNSNINKQKNNNINIINKQNNNNFISRMPNGDRAKNNRGIPRKSPIPIPKGFIPGKYLIDENMSYISKNSSNSNNVSHFTANSQLINNNYSISNLSQISGYSHNSFNNNQINFAGIMDNQHTRAYSNNVHSSMTQKRFNGNNNYNIQNNKKIVQNKSANNLLNRQNKIKINNYINNNKNFNNLIDGSGMKNLKNINKSPNIRKKDYLTNTIKRNNNNSNNNNNIFNNSNISNDGNISYISNVSMNDKIGYKTSSNFHFSGNNNLNLYENGNNFNQNDINLNMNNYGKPLVSGRQINNFGEKNNNTNKNKNNKINNMLLANKFGLNSNNINLNNYNTNQPFNGKRTLFNNNSNRNNNYIHQYNSHNTKRNHSENMANNRNNIDKINNNYGKNLNNMNPMVNLHIINKGQIINNNYNNVNSNMNNLYVYKYDISQNNNFQGQYNTNGRDLSNNRSNSKNSLRNNNNINKMNNFTNSAININDNNLENFKNINNERQNIHKSNKKGVQIRSNSSSGIGVTGELNNILNQRNNSKMNHNLINAKKIDPTKFNRNNNNINNKSHNKSNSKIMSPKKKPIIKRIRKIHHFTHVGFNGERDKDFNQDIAFLEKNFAGNNSYLYLAVCDGHGIEGHEVSGFIKTILPKELSNSLFQKDILTSDTNSKKKIYNIIGQTFIKVNEQLINNEAINCFFSGTTCISVIYTPIKLICANIGDSRAVLGRFDNKLKKWIAINLSRDHKPTEEDEARRIFKKGGRIKPYVDEETGEEVGPQRVWVKDEEVPGLAMTRSFGDRVASIAGTICIPEIKEYYFTEGDKFLILASDGIWEFIQSEECINIIGKFYLNNNIEGCCEYLYIESRKRWIKEEEVVDDITMLLAFFE